MGSLQSKYSDAIAAQYFPASADKKAAFDFDVARLALCAHASESCRR